jgi:TRAP-type C4-dicarboxylate transport system substrate-binding protein
MGLVSAKSVSILLKKKVKRSLKNSLLSTLLTCGIFSFGMGITQLQAQTVQLRVTSFHPERAAFSQAIISWAEQVTKKTDGRIKFQFFWGGSLLSAQDTLPGVADGRADVGLTGAVYHPSQMPLSMIDSLPFMSPNGAAVGEAFNDMYASSSAFRSEYEKSGVILAGYAPVSVNLFFSKRELPTVESLKGLRARTLGLAANALVAVGANPIALPQPQVYDGLEKGLLDAAFGAGIDLGVDFGFQKVAKNVVDPNYGVWAHGILILNKVVYEKMTPSDRKIIDEMRKEFTKKYMEILIIAENDRCKALKEANATMLVWPASETEKWKQILGNIARDKWISSQTIPNAGGFLSEYESLVRGYEQKIKWSSPLERCQKAQ